MKTNDSNNTIIFLASGLDFHAIDWFKSAKRTSPQKKFIFITDMIFSEGNKRRLTNDISCKKLFIIDRFLFNKESFLGNKWRNLIKLIFIPLQIYLLRKILKKYPNYIIHAHTMYYILLCWLAKSKYISSPQGDEILIRPQKSFFYRYFSKKALLNSFEIIVDSQNLKQGIRKLINRNAVISQYGIDTKTINRSINLDIKRYRITSIRALYPLYRIHQIFKSRELSLPNNELTLYYPFAEKDYKSKINNYLKYSDSDLGRIEKKINLYKVLNSTILAISIPESDSSPRSVYEAIFCGCAIATTYNLWIKSLPKCMKNRIIIVDLDYKDWLKVAFKKAKLITRKPFLPSKDAIEMFDQFLVTKNISNIYY